MIVTVGNTKGGVGKTTIALNLAIARALQGRDVLLIDGDRQETAQTAIDIRAASNKSPAIACAVYADGRTLVTQLQLLQSKFDDVVIDSGGRDSAALRAAMSMSDVVVVPFAPRSLDVWALGQLDSLIEEVKGLRPDLQVIAILNNADPQGTDNADAAAAVADYPNMRYIPTPLRRRKALATAAGQGMSILEHSPKDAKGIEEMTALVTSVFGVN
jgi:chromosome partitioning protein